MEKIKSRCLVVIAFVLFTGLIAGCSGENGSSQDKGDTHGDHSH